MLVRTGAVPRTCRLAGPPAALGLCPTARVGTKSARSRAQAAAPAPRFRGARRSAKRRCGDLPLLRSETYPAPGNLSSSPLVIADGRGLSVRLGRGRHGPAAGALSGARQGRLSLIGLGNL